MRVDDMIRMIRLWYGTDGINPPIKAIFQRSEEEQASVALDKIIEKSARRGGSTANRWAADSYRQSLTPHRRQHPMAARSARAVQVTWPQMRCAVYPRVKILAIIAGIRRNRALFSPHARGGFDWLNAAVARVCCQAANGPSRI
jgi:hypothetical protein